MFLDVCVNLGGGVLTVLNVRHTLTRITERNLETAQRGSVATVTWSLW